MITYDKKLEDMTMQCDECEQAEETVGGSWQECIDELKARGWKFRKEDEAWIHVCPTCQEEDKEHKETVV